MPGMKGTMKEFKHGTLKSSSGHKVTNPKQAIAIGLSEDRKMGHEVPEPMEGSKKDMMIDKKEKTKSKSKKIDKHDKIWNKFKSSKGMK